MRPLRALVGGRSGIRTHEAQHPAVFKTAAFNHSAILPVDPRHRCHGDWAIRISPLSVGSTVWWAPEWEPLVMSVSLLGTGVGVPAGTCCGLKENRPLVSEEPVEVSASADYALLTPCLHLAPFDRAGQTGARRYSRSPRGRLRSSVAFRRTLVRTSVWNLYGLLAGTAIDNPMRVAHPSSHGQGRLVKGLRKN